MTKLGRYRSVFKLTSSILHHDKLSNPQNTRCSRKHATLVMHPYSIWIIAGNLINRASAACHLSMPRNNWSHGRDRQRFYRSIPGLFIGPRGNSRSAPSPSRVRRRSSIPFLSFSHVRWPTYCSRSSLRAFGGRFQSSLSINPFARYQSLHRSVAFVSDVLFGLGP
jgi:hypothetical protein